LKTLETFFGLPNFLGVATVAIGTPLGSRIEAGAGQVSGAGSYPTCSLEDLAMRYDWTPLWRSTIGFDRLFDVLDEVQRTAEESYPPYNIERLDENRFQISVALAGFMPDEVALTVEQNILTLEGRKSEKDEKIFLHRGISARNFKRQFTLADHVEVRGARFENGLLVIDLQREIPEAMKPRRIAINGAGPGDVAQVESRAA
jgi:molecular chaperone IbpA